MACAHARADQFRLELTHHTMPSHIDWVREVCLSLPHATEDIQWGDNLLFRVAKKVFCIAPLEPQATAKLSIKCTPERFAELIEVEGIIPAPYMARNHWIAFVEMTALRRDEIEDLILNSYQLVLKRLSKKAQAKLTRAPRKPAPRGAKLAKLKHPPK